MGWWGSTPSCSASTCRSCAYPPRFPASSFCGSRAPPPPPEGRRPRTNYSRPAPQSSYGPRPPYTLHPSYHPSHPPFSPYPPNAPSTAYSHSPSQYPRYLSALSGVSNPGTISKIRRVKPSRWETTPDGQFQIKRREQRNLLTKGGPGTSGKSSRRLFRWGWGRDRDSSSSSRRRGRRSRSRRSPRRSRYSSSDDATLTGALKQRLIDKIKGEKPQMVEKEDAVYAASEQLFGSVGLGAATLIGEVVSGVTSAASGAKLWYDWALGRDPDETSRGSSLRSGRSKDRGRSGSRGTRRTSSRSVSTDENSEYRRRPRSASRRTVRRRPSRTSRSKSGYDEEDSKDVEEEDGWSSRQSRTKEQSKGWWAKCKRMKNKRRQRRIESKSRGTSASPSRASNTVTRQREKSNWQARKTPSGSEGSSDRQSSKEPMNSETYCPPPHILGI